MNTEPKRGIVLAEWAETLVDSARHVLERMDQTLTVAEAKLALTRSLREQRRVRTRLNNLKFQEFYNA